MKKILVTGGAGFIGSHLCEALLRMGKEVLVLDDLSTGRLENISHLQEKKNFHFTPGTVLNSMLLESSMAKVDFVFHLAAVVGVQKIIDVPIETFETNVIGTHNVLAIAATLGRPCLLTSSSEVYGKSNKHPLTEDDDTVCGPTTKTRWSYACSKAMDEFLALAYHDSRALPVVITRLFNTTGPRQTGRYGMVLPRFVDQALRGEPITVFGDGQQSRCFADVSDVIRALLLLVGRREAIGEVFNVGNPEEISVLDLAMLVRKLTGSVSEIKFIPYAEAYAPGFEDMQRRVPNIDKITRLTGFKPKLKLVNVVRRLIESKREGMKLLAGLPVTAAVPLQSRHAALAE